MNLEEKSYIEAQVASKAKGIGIAYIFLIFLGGFGAHRFYLGKTGSAVGLLLVTIITGWFTLFIPSIIWIIVDACLIPGYIESDREKVRKEASYEVENLKNNQM
ncbi:TM2 domain-containing protein [Staphylococcus sp. GSSP0090]|nr:TM2 domain-containing protein [Staphylococcus sp. GSSP0090]